MSPKVASSADEPEYTPALPHDACPVARARTRPGAGAERPHTHAGEAFSLGEAGPKLLGCALLLLGNECYLRSRRAAAAAAA